MLHFGEHVRGEDHRAVPAERADQAPNLDALVGVETLRRLVEDEQIRSVQDRLRQPDALAESLRELADRPVVHALDPRARDRRVERLAPGESRELAQVGDEGEIVGYQHVPI